MRKRTSGGIVVHLRTFGSVEQTLLELGTIP